MSFLEDNDHEGQMSIKARRKMEKAINWLVFKAKPLRRYHEDSDSFYTFRVNFITLTLPAHQVHSDKEITNRCLGNWLDVARKQFGITNYVWKAEAQDNGNIHYHIVSNTWIDKMDIRRTWNKSVELLGYVSAYEYKWKHRNPNSTDVHSVKSVKNIASYVACYMSKNQMFECIGKLVITGTGTREILYGSEEYRNVKSWKKLGKVIGSILGAYHRPVTGRLWGCSRELSQCKPVRIGEDTHNFAALQEFIEQSDFKRIELEHANLYCGKVASEAKQFLPSLYKMLQEV